MSGLDSKNAAEDSVDTADEQEQPAPAEDVAADGVENVPKENGTSECTTESIDGEEADDDEVPAETEETKEKPNLKRLSDALDVAAEGTDDKSTPEKKAKLEESTEASNGDAN